MKKEEAGFRLHKLLHNNSQAGVRQLMDEVFDDFEKETEKLKKDRDYWKLSFEKQVRASRGDDQKYVKKALRDYAK